MLEDRCNTVAHHRYVALIGLAGIRHVQAHHQLAALMSAQQIRHGGRQYNRVAARHATHLQLFVAIHDQQLDRAIATQLKGQAPGLLQLSSDQCGHGGGFAQQLGNRRLVVTVDLHLSPGVP
jgi:hypothetical protein